MYENNVAKQIMSLRGEQNHRVFYLRFSPSRKVGAALWNTNALRVLELNGANALNDSEMMHFAKVMDLILVDSEDLATLVRERVIDFHGEIAVHVSPATDVKVFRPQQKEFCRQAVGLPHKDPILLHISGFQWYHDFSTIRDGFVSIIKDYPSARLILLGDGARRHEVKQLFAEWMPSGRVAMPGAVGKERLTQYIGAADVCLDLLLAEKLREGNLRSYKIYEYLSCERPVVESVDCSRGVSEWANPILSIVPPENPRALSDAVKDILEGEAFWADRAKLGRLYVERYRSWDAAIQSTLSHIEISLARRRAHEEAKK